MKFTPGPAIASASGSIGGTTFSHNRYGAYTRKRTVPTDPNTDRQQAVKNNFSFLSSIWNTEVPADDRQGWADYAANVPRVDSLGQTHYLTAQQWFMGCLTLQMQVGLPLNFAAPTVFNRGELPGLTGIPIPGDPVSAPNMGSYLNLQGGDGLLNLQFADDLNERGRVLIYLSPPKNPTINYHRAPWRYWAAASAQAGTQISESTAPPAAPPRPWPYSYATGQVVFVRMRLLSADNRYSPAFDYKLPILDVGE